MEYKRLNDKEHPHLLTFNGHEPEVVRAAYREHIFFLALKGNTGSMEDYEAAISGWEEDGESRSLKPIRPTDVAEVLEDFSERTEEIIQRIPEETAIPAFQSDDIGERFRMGRLATKLATEIREKCALPTPAPEASAQETLPETLGQIDDRDLHNWIGDEQAE